MPISAKIKVVNEHLEFPKVNLVPPNTTGFFLLAMEIDKGPLFLTESRKKKVLIKSLKALLKEMKALDFVKDASLFKARILPPGRIKYLKKEMKVNIANYDVVVLIETKDEASLSALKNTELYEKMNKIANANSIKQHAAEAMNSRRMGDVNHDRQGVFLFNFFYAENVERSLGIWEYTAGWFQTVTGLDNSTLLQPLENSNKEYGIINHCRWDKMTDVMPSLIFNKTLKTYVLDNFEANQTVAMPILYKLA